MKNNEQSSVLLFFIDGLGIGKRGDENPLATIENVEPLAQFIDEKSDIIYDGILVPTDPRLGIEGRPQSATGQTTILTGVNAAAHLGKHKLGFPNQSLRELIAEHSIFLKLKRLQIEPNAFVNAYSPKFFEETPRWKSATTCAIEAADERFRNLDDLINNKAIFHDFTNQSLIEQNFQVPLRSPKTAGSILARIAAENRFTLYEYFITDKIGHAQDFAAASVYLPPLARFIRETLCQIDLSKTTFILTSDHGNIEDLSVRTHTLNDVPTIIWGRKNREVSEKIKSLADLTPVILQLLSE